MQHFTRRLRATMTVMAAMLAILALSVTAALAQYPPDEDFGVACAPTEPGPGDTVECDVVGAQANERLSATAQVNPVLYDDSFDADAEGRARFAFDIPADREQGERINVSVVGEESGEAETVLAVDEDADATDEDGEPVDADEVADTDDDRLPVTGGQILLLGLVGVGLVGGGVLALRKRSRVA